MLKNMLRTLVFATTATFIAACGEDATSTTSEANSDERSESRSISILYPNWAEGVAMTHLAKVVLEDHGHTVDITRLEPGPIYASLSTGDSDLYLDAWLPHTHKSYWDRFGDKIDVIGVIFDDASTGLVVPSYVNIDSITELNDNKSMFDGKIYGIGAGAGIHTNTIRAIDEYPLDYEQITSSETSMMAELRRATNVEDPIIITGWKPHYMWDQYDLKMLDDPKQIYEIDEIQILSRKGFSKDEPEMTQFFSRYELNSDQLHELMAMVSEEDENNPEIGARKFYDKYQSMIDAWFEE